MGFNPSKLDSDDNGVNDGDEDNDNDGFSAPYGGPNGSGNKCAQMLCSASALVSACRFKITVSSVIRSLLIFSSP